MPNMRQSLDKGWLVNECQGPSRFDVARAGKLYGWIAAVIEVWYDRLIEGVDIIPL